MDDNLRWAIAARDEQSNSTNPTSTLSDSLASDLFRDKFMGVAREGSNGEKIMRGFLIGVAIGLIVACFFCCWYPCCRTTRVRHGRRPRRRPMFRRRRDRTPAVEEAQPETQEVRTDDNPDTAAPPTTSVAATPPTAPATAPATTPTAAPASAPTTAPAAASSAPPTTSLI